MLIVNKTVNFAYKKIAKPYLFSKDPEWAHDKTLASAKLLSNNSPVKWLMKRTMAYQSQNLNQTIDNMFFKNPIGLAAGWDKDGQAFQLMANLGFGFAEVGSITKQPYRGNDYPRLTRLQKSKSIVVNYGLKNDGVDKILPRIQQTRSDIPIGTNIAMTNSKDCLKDDLAVQDYSYTFNKLKNIGDYFTINISCPNTFGGQPFHEPKRLGLLLSELYKIKTKKPIYLKISPDISQKNIQAIVDLAYKYNIDGFICGNLTKNRKLPNIYETDLPQNGGLSGAVVKELSNKQISTIYKLIKNDKTIIGLGGIFNAEDAWQKIGLGANLVQLITGLIYEGPGIIGQINKGLAGNLKKHGFKNIQEARGFLQ